MIDFYNTQITDLFQNPLSDNPEVRALAWAVLKEKQRIASLAKTTRTMAMVDELPEPILDVLAVELRSPYYTQDMEIEQKRSIIKGTMVWFFKAGTPAAVQELISSVFGSGKVVEWYDFTEGEKKPGTFDIVTSARMTEEMVSDFLRIIRRVKNTRSHIRRVLVEREYKTQKWTAAAAVAAPSSPVVNHRDAAAHGDPVEAVKSGAISSPARPVISYTEQRGESITSPTKTASGATSAPERNIMNTAAARSRAAKPVCRYGAVLAIQSGHIVIA